MEKLTIQEEEVMLHIWSMGDGKIFSYEIRSALKIRTKETGYDAIQVTE